MAYKWFKTAFDGVRYREHPTRMIGRGKNRRPDRYYVIRYQVPEVQPDGSVKKRRHDESLGWSSRQEWTDAKAAAERQRLIEANKRGEGPRTRKEESEHRLRAAAAERARGITVAEFWDQEYLPHLIARLPKERSRRQEVNHFERRIRPLMGDKPLKDIKYTDTEKMIAQMAADGLKERTQQYAVGTLYRIWKRAAKSELVSKDKNPAEGHKISVNNQRKRALTPDELADILAHLAVLNPAAHDITLFCAFTGCRFSEAANLRWDHVDIEDGAAYFLDTKNNESRTAYLVPQVVKMLQDRKKRGQDNVVFLRENGKPYRQPPGSFETAVKNLGLNNGKDDYNKVTFHTLRHTAATRAAKSTNFKDMQVIFGWKTPAMVFRYAHGDKDTQRRAMDTIANSMTQETGRVVPFRRKKTA